MGESRGNKNSTQYRGPLPDVVPGADIQWIVEPSKAFIAQMEEMKAAGIEGPVVCGEEDREVVLYVRAAWGVPIQTLREIKWSHVPMAELARMPLPEFRRRHAANFIAAGQDHIASSVAPKTETSNQ